MGTIVDTSKQCIYLNQTYLSIITIKYLLHKVRHTNCVISDTLYCQVLMMAHRVVLLSLLVVGISLSVYCEEEDEHLQLKDSALRALTLIHKRWNNNNSNNNNGVCVPVYGIGYSFYYKLIRRVNSWEICANACYHSRGCSHWSWNFQRSELNRKGNNNNSNN